MSRHERERKRECPTSDTRDLAFLVREKFEIASQSKRVLDDPSMKSRSIFSARTGIRRFADDSAVTSQRVLGAQWSVTFSSAFTSGYLRAPHLVQTVSSIFPRHSVQDVVSLRARNIIAALNSGPIRAPPSSTSIKLHRLSVMLTSHPRRTECYWC